MQGTWDGVDKIYCISLEQRTDRQAEARAQFARVGIGDRVEFVIVRKHPGDCEQGIFESHQLCMRKGLAAGAERILIFEDDIVFDRVTPEILANSMNFMTTHNRWRILFLGCMVKRSRGTIYPSILKIAYRSLAQGYVIHRRLAQAIVTETWHHVPFDDYLKELKDNQFYALYPSIAFQSHSRSDNERYLPLDRFRRILGGLIKLQKRNEFYHRHRGVIIGAHAFVSLLILLAAML
jgi:GR25 family glycosyltransferase involved in LPS biosynthesis